MDDQEIRKAFEQEADTDIMGMFSSNRSNLPPLAQEEYARSISSMMKISNPSASTSDSFNNAMNSQDPITQKHMTLRSAIDEANRAGSSKAMELISSTADPDYGMQVLEQSRKQNEERENLISDPFGAEKIEAMAEAFPDASPDQLMQYAANTAMAQDLSRIAASVSTGDMVKDFAKMMIPGRMSYNLGELVGDTPIIDAWNSSEKLTNAIDNWNSLPVERQMNMWPYLRDEVMKQMGPTEGLGILQKFLSPEGRESTSDYSNVWVGLDFADLGSTAAGIAVGTASWLNRYNKVRRLGDLGAVDTAADANVKVITSKNGMPEKEFGITKETAVANGEPMDSVEKIDASAFVGASAETQQRLVNIQKNISKAMENIKDSTPIIDPFSETTSDVARAIAKREEAFNELYPSFELTDMETTRTGVTSFTTKAQVFDINTGQKRTIKKNWDMTLNDNGEYDYSLKTMRSKWLNSPKYVLRGNKLATEDLYKALHAETVGADVINNLSDKFMEAHKLLKGNPFTKKSKRETVDNILEEGNSWKDAQGNAVGKNFTYTELADRGLEPDQIEYYYAMRQFSDSLFQFHNDMTRNRMVMENIKDISLPYNKSHVKGFGKVHDTPESARTTIAQANRVDKQSEITNVYDFTDGKVKSATDIDWDDVYEKGHRLVSVRDQNVIGPGGTRYSTVILDKKLVSDLPPIVMRNRPGYLPRSYTKGVYANTIVRKGSLNGVPNREVERRTLRLYDNQYEQEADAAELMEKLKQQGLDIGDADSGKEWVMISTDPKEPANFQASVEALGGRMYTSPRASKPIPFGSMAEEAELVSPVQSIRRQLGHLSVHYPRHAQRLAMRDRIQKFADSHRIPFDIHTPVEGTKDTHKFLEEMRVNYLEWAAHSTKDEAWAAARMRSLYESMVGQKGVSRDSKKARLAWHLINASPVQRIRTANFHLLLGFFNPVQLWIQAQGGLIAASVLPVSRATKVAKGMPALATAINTRNAPTSAKIMGKALGVGEDEGRIILKAYKDTGFDNSVRANADIRQVEDNMADPLSVIRKLGKHDTVFYAMGERFNRRLSWMVSLERHMAKNQGKSYADLKEADWNEIRDSANTFMLSMHAANKARWQKGIASIPTQFLQVQAKFIEEMMNLDNGLTAGERARIGLTQLLLYGSAAIPFVGDDAANFAGSLLGMDEEEVRESPALQGGIMQSFFSSLGVESNVSSRTAILAGMEDLWGTIFGDTSFAEAMAGPASSTGARAIESVRQFTMTGLGLAGEGEYNPAIYGKAALESVARMSSTYSQIEKYMLLRNTNNMLQDKYGNNVDQLNWQTSFAQLIGFTPNSQEKMWTLRQEQAAQKRLRSEGEEKLAEGWQMLARANTDTGRQQANAFISTVLNAYFSTPMERREALRNQWSKMNNPVTEHDQFMHEWYTQKKMEGIRDTEPYIEESE